MRAKVEDAVNFERDDFSRGVVNVDKNSLTAYKKQRENLKRLENLESSVLSIKSDLDYLKNALTVVVNKLNK